MFRRLLALLTLVFAASAAPAQWKEAQSANFIVYSEGSEAELREFTEKLERFNYVLRAYHNVQGEMSPYKLRVFLMPNTNAVGRLVGSDGVAGFYIRGARGQLMVGTRDRGARRGNARLDAEQILLHEYTHHFMYRYFPAAYPVWYSEGFAEFWGAVRFRPNNVVEVGLPAEHRFGSLQTNRWAGMESLLTAKNYADFNNDIDLIYAQGWLLMRYLFENPERRRQLQVYLNAINEGVDFGEAARSAFGDLRRFNSELYNYAGRGSFNVLQLPFRTLPVGDIAIRTTSPAESALMLHEIRLGMGVPAREFDAFLREVRSAAAPHGGDPAALRMLAEAERVGGNAEAARAAADRLLALKPDDARGLLFRAKVDLEALRAAQSTDAAAWNAARAPLRRAIERAPADPLVLEAYYDSYIAQGLLPPEEAQSALYDAMELAPSDGELRFKLAIDFEQRGMIDEAIAIIRPEAFRTPHPGDQSDRERRRSERLRERWRAAGEERREESAPEFYDRLVAARARRTAAPAS
jgi:tetratricopeptide (TPR) repeat protein